MILPLTLLLGAIAYCYQKSKIEMTHFEGNQFDMTNEQLEDDNLYKDLEDLFI